MKITHCRFCAKTKSSERIFNLHHHRSALNDVTSKLAILNIDLFNGSEVHNKLPLTICFECLVSLNKAYEFVDSFRLSQIVLTQVYKSLNESSDDDEQPDQVEIIAYVETKQEDSVPSMEVATTEIYLSIEKNESSSITSDSSQPVEYDNPIESCSEMKPAAVKELLSSAVQNAQLTDNKLNEEKMSHADESVMEKWSDYPWVCGYCDNEFPDMTMLRNHAKSVHKKCSLYTCKDCNNVKELGYFMTFIKHVQKHRESLRHICPYCNESSDNIEDHINVHVVSPQVACPYCGEILQDENSLVIHTAQYSNPMQTKLRKRRKPGTPITAQELMCDQCPKVYKTLNSLRKHRKEHTQGRKHIEKKTIQSKEDMNRDYMCEQCGKSFYTAKALKSHYLCHETTKPHVCKLCNRSFRVPSKLKTHMLMHYNVKPFSCDECNKRFRLKEQLKSHKIVHTDSMPFVCKYCNKAFKFKQILTNHERQHTGAKPYACDKCSMQFTNWSNYNKHMKCRHGTDTSKKKITPEGVFPVNPETSKVVEMDSNSSEEWKPTIIIPAKKRSG